MFDMSPKKMLVAGILKELAGVTDERIIAAIVGLTDTKFQFGPSDLKFEPEKLTGLLQFSVNGEPASVEITFRGKVVDQMDAFLADLGLKYPTVPDMLHTSPSKPAPGVEFLTPIEDAARLTSNLGIAAQVENGRPEVMTTEAV